MPTPLHLRLRTEDPDNILSPLARMVHDHYERRGYDVERRRQYTAVILHFGYWLSDHGVTMPGFTSDHMEAFLAEHESGCRCSGFWKMRTGVTSMRYALNLAVKMRARRLIQPMKVVAIDREVQAFDKMLEEVWGMSADSRRKHRNLARRLLIGVVKDGRVDMADLTPLHIRQFVLAGRGWKPATIRSYAVSIRCYLRYRTLLGDDVRQLKKAIPAPAMKTPAKLQTGFSPAELERLLEVSAEIGRTRKRVHAIVRCLADLGMRSIEVTRLTLDDIDWEKGLIWVRSKSRRSDPMPLPFATGEAIADYIVQERQATQRREVFVRHVAPLGEPITPRAVQRSVYAVYEKLGWDCTRIHIFRHTIASRLVNGAVPLKQVADIMRHRSVVTTAGYARVDQNRLSAVALPWPGERA